MTIIECPFFQSIFHAITQEVDFLFQSSLGVVNGHVTSPMDLLTIGDQPPAPSPATGCCPQPQVFLVKSSKDIRSLPRGSVTGAKVALVGTNQLFVTL